MKKAESKSTTNCHTFLKFDDFARKYDNNKLKTKIKIKNNILYFLK